MEESVLKKFLNKNTILFKLLRPLLVRYRYLTIRKIVVGAGGVGDKGWWCFEREELDICKEEDWGSLFRRGQLKAILAEHVWEHMTLEDGVLAARNCFLFFGNRGYFRAAAPDGYHPDPAYIEQVRPSGIGSGADDHKLLYNYETFSGVFSAAGLKVELLEYFDENGRFHRVDWNEDDGKILRSARHDQRNTPGELAYTSVILDAVKAC